MNTTAGWACTFSRRVSVWVLVGQCLVGCAAAPSAVSGPSSAALPSAPPPTLSALRWQVFGTPDGALFDPATLQGRWVLVHALNTACVPCEAQLAEVQSQTARLGLTWVLLVLDAHPERTLPRFLDIWKPTATVLVAPRGVRPDATPLGPVEVVPEFRLYDPSGTLQERFPGFLPAGRVEAMVRR
ncbi:MAG: TlpA family protein disulfide reductase [Bradymonadia bacterium]